ncbi:cytochrome C assembly family protein [Arenibaculum pallidiluteum]|uniref:cytochrome C assembly family protein n=1 Tax=Arenibaculum pallidiluteum TaxID=2812559 RepID=UPI001A96A0AB|nr:cytochrome c biogenesis protein CcsA [Arenibaculum pallidiluteum]
MAQNLVFGLSALIAMLPAAAASLLRGSAARADAKFWALLALALAGPCAWVWGQVGNGWRTGLSATLWISIAVCLAIFAVLCLATRWSWRLAPLLLPYLAALGLLAAATGQAPAPQNLRGGAPEPWIDLHIAVSVTTYALLTIAAVAALAGFLQERALKARRPTPLTRRLPPLAEAERLQVRLLSASEVVLGAGLLTGMTVLRFETGHLLVFDHKTLFSIAAFVVIGALLAAHAASGVRGRRAGRLVLLAYLLLTLGYPGVKFVTDVLLR